MRDILKGTCHIRLDFFLRHPKGEISSRLYAMACFSVLEPHLPTSEQITLTRCLFSALLHVSENCLKDNIFLLTLSCSCYVIYTPRWCGDPLALGP